MMNNFKIWIKQCFKYNNILSLKDAVIYQKIEDDYKNKAQFDKKLFSYLKNKIKNTSSMIKFVRWGDIYYNIIPNMTFITVVESDDLMLEKASNVIFSMIGEIKKGLVIVIEGNGLYIEDKYYLSFGFRYV